mgnify:CR=1 FL=1
MKNGKKSGVLWLTLLGMFSVIIMQTRRSARIALEKETAEAESRVKHQEMEEKLALQEQLLAQVRHKARQDKLITALASDYWSVYYLELDTNEGSCCQSHSDVGIGFKVGECFPYLDKTFPIYKVIID